MDYREQFIQKMQALNQGQGRFDDQGETEERFQQRLKDCQEPRDRFLLLSERLSKTGRFYADDSRAGAYDNTTSRTISPRDQFINQSRAMHQDSGQGIQGRRVTRMDGGILKAGQTIYDFDTEHVYDDEEERLSCSL